MSNNNANDTANQRSEKKPITKPFSGAVRDKSRDTWGIAEFKYECLQEMAANGCALLNAKDLICDGKIHRYSSDSEQSKPDEWYAAFEFSKMDNITGHSQHHLIVAYGSWTNSTKFTYHSWKNDSSYSREYLNQLHQIRIQKMKEAETEIQKERDEQAKEAAQVWENASLTPPDDSYKRYINKKGVDPLGIRYCLNPSGWPSIIVPFRNNAGVVRALEYISLGDDGKKFARCFGGRAGNFHVINDETIKNGDPIIAAEGWATGVSIFMANGGKVCITGGSSNIENVVGNLCKLYPDSKITVAADLGKGEAAAYAAAKKYPGTKVVLPVFPVEKSIDPETGKPYTDFNDAHKVLGIEEVRQQLSKAELVKSHAEELQELAKSILMKNDPCEDFSIDSLPPILRDYVKSICETTDAHPLVITSAAITAVSVFFNTNVLLPYGEYFQDLYPNFWFMTITKSGFFKSTALCRGGALAYEKKSEISQTIQQLKLELAQLDDNDADKKADIEGQIRQLELENPVVADDITPERFIQYLAEGHIGAMFQNELGAFIEKAIENGLAKALTNWYDMARGFWKQTRTQGEFHIDLPFFSICGVTTLHWIQQSLQQGDNRDVHGGFFARFIIFLPPIKKTIPPGLPKKNKILCPESIRIKADFENAVLLIAKNIKGNQRIFTISPEAWEIFSDHENKTGIHEILYEMVEKNYNDQTKEILNSFLKRWSPQILKLAMIMELLRDKDADKITPQSINEAVNIIFPAIKSTAMLFESVLGASEIQRKCQKVIDYIAKRDGKVARSKLLKSEVLSNALAKNYDEILDLLIQRNDIEEFPKTPRGEKPTGKTFYLLKNSND